MSAQAADEAQTLIYPAVRIATGRIRDGRVEHAEVIEIPEAFFEAFQLAVLEQLTIAKGKTLDVDDYPSVAANSVVQRLILDGVIDQKNAQKTCDLVQLEIKRGIEHLAEDVHDRYASRLPITLRSLVPLITRRSGTK